MLWSPNTLLAAALTLPLLPSVALRADDWPQWRGPNRDGVCSETGLLESFPAEGLKVRWRVPVGWGFSSPVVAQGRVYLADSELVKPKAKERLHCFDETTGKPLWTHAYDVAYEDWAFDPDAGDRSGRDTDRPERQGLYLGKARPSLLSRCSQGRSALAEEPGEGLRESRLLRARRRR